MGFLKLGKRTIGSRIASLVTFSVLSAMFILAIFLSLLQLQQSVNQKRQALESTAYIYASALADDIESQNSSEAQHVLRSIARVPNILHAAAINNKGETIAAMGSVTFLTSDQILGHPTTIELLTKGNLPVAVDIIRGGETVGKLVVLGDIRDIRTQLLWTLFTTAIASIAAALLAFPISAPLQRRIVNPITSLTSAMKLMRETRTFTPTEVNAAEGETRVLVETFNSMVEDLHSRDSALQRLAYFDPLTGLPNRVNFQRILNDAVENKVSSAAIYIFDIDNFHAINDAMGHSIGDALLMDVSARLKAEAPADGQLCRIGGDEFALFAPGIRTIVEAQDALAKMIASLYPPVNILGHEVHISASTGVVMVPQHAGTSPEIQRYLDLALHEAKTSGVGRVVFFHKGLADNLEEEAEITKGLRNALNADQISPFYQPIVNLRTGKVEGFEALARWIDPVKGFIPPAKFIPIAEKSGLISQLGMQIMKASCAQAKAWKDAGKPDWTVSVNVSAAQTMQADFVEQVRAILDETCLPPHLLCIELTESLFVGKSMAIVQTILKEFRDLGVVTALDDFGTGYSSLSYLEHLPFDKLKIDRAFVHNAKEGSKNTELLKGIISLAHGLGMIVVAEGAETQEELSILHKLNADSVQGFVIARPQPATEATLAADIHDLKAQRAATRSA